MEKIILLAAIGGVAIYYMQGNLPEKDTATFPYSTERVTTMLINARTTLPRRDGDGKIEIWSEGKSARGVKLHMKYASSAPLLECHAVINPVDAEQTRVVVDCGGSRDPKSAISQTEQQLRAPMFEEHIASTLRKREFDRSRVDQKESAVIFNNMGSMQAEALRASQAQQPK